MRSEDVERLNLLAREYKEILKTLDVDKYNTPINLETEKKLFFEALDKGIEYNPKFEFLTPHPKWAEHLHSFQSKIQPTSNQLEGYLYSSVSNQMLELEAVATHSPSLITAASIAANGIPQQYTLDEASRILAEQDILGGDVVSYISAAQLGDFFRDWFSKLDLAETWRVNLTTAINAKITVETSRMEINIRKDAKFTPDDAQRLLFHEIGTHVFRSLNAEMQPLTIFSVGLLGYLTTEEGLATYNEELFGFRDMFLAKKYALRAFASLYGLSMSFYNIFCKLASYSHDRRELFEIVRRCKRGFSDTSLNGAHVKDHVYLTGFLDVKRHLAKRPDDYALLMSGKVSLNMQQTLTHLREEGLLVDPLYLPKLLV